MGRYKAGESGNAAGRPKGARNKTSSEVQKRLLKLLDDNIDDLDDDIKSLTPKERATLLINLAKHVTPSAFSPEHLTVSQMEQIIEFWENKNKQDEQETNIDAED